MIFCPLYSGSSGNALFVQAGNTRLLIDAGKSGKCIREALLSIGVDPATLNAILVTHEHSDHIAGVGVLCRKYHIPVLVMSFIIDGQLDVVAHRAPGQQGARVVLEHHGHRLGRLGDVLALEHHRALRGSSTLSVVQGVHAAIGRGA